MDNQTQPNTIINKKTIKNNDHDKVVGKNTECMDVVPTLTKPA